MKRIITSRIFTFILGALIFGGVGSALAYTYAANQITYTPKDTTREVDNVKDAIDDLYNKKWNIALLGTDNYDATHNYDYQHTYDLTTYNNYKKFTEDNFIVSFKSLSAMSGGGSTSLSGSLTKSYDQNTGILTVTLSQSVYNGVGSILRLDIYLIENL